jgi:hypothetical protein
LASHEVVARNDAETSENKIHDDAVAQQYGSGGLVPGVTVYGYLTWLPASAWGRDWPSRVGCRSAWLGPSTPATRNGDVGGRR